MSTRRVTASFGVKGGAFGVLVHGGAGTWPEQARAFGIEGCSRAAGLAARLLGEGGSALDAVQCAVEALEDDPHFNAGRGAHLTSEGHLELDAAIMDGRDLRAGAVTGLGAFEHPVRVARRVLEHGRHVFYAGAGADAFARSQGFELSGEASMVTAKAREKLERALAAARAREGDTVGAVAYDTSGNFAAATSTGGTSAKLPGRVGDSPILGAGTYAENALGAASATGLGEGIMRCCLSLRALGAGALHGDRRAAACEMLTFMLERTGATGGLIVAGPDQSFCWARTTEFMPWALAREGAAPESGA